MNYPKEFYYHDAVSGIEYTNSPTGTLDVNRLLQNKAYWIAPTKIEKKPKNLILTDWRARNWDPDKKEAFIEAIKEFIHQGGKCYIWCDGELVPLLKENVNKLLEDRSTLNSISPTSIEEVALKAYEQYKMPREQLHCLDDYWVDCLVQGKVLEKHPRFIYFSDWSSLDEDDQEKLKVLLQKNKSLDCIVVDSLRTDVTSFTKAFSGKPIQYIYQKASLSAWELFQIIPNSLSLAKIKKLTLENTIKFEIYHLNLLFQAAPEIKWLTINNSDFLSDNDLLVLKPLQHLASIKIHLKPTERVNGFILNSHSITEQGIHQILDMFPNLNELDVQYLNNKKFNKPLPMPAFNEPLPMPAFNKPLPKLKRIHLQYGQFPFDFLHKIFSAAPNLISLDLSGSSIQDSLPQQQCTKLLNLLHLDLLNAKIQPQELHALLISCPNLKTLRCSQIFAKPLPANSLSQLEDLDITSSNITSEQLANLLKAAPNLKQIKIESCDKLTAPLIIPANSLNQLEQLIGHLSGYLEGILKASPNLIELTLSRGELSSVRSLPPLCLRKMNRIDMSHLVLDAKSLQSLLRASPDLSSLTLSRCTVTGTGLSLPYPLEHLNKINCLKSNFSNNTIEPLINAAPNIKELNLYNDEELNLDARQITTPLPLLNKIVISIRGVQEVSALKVLLKAGTNIKVLSLGVLKDTLLEEHLQSISSDRIEHLDLSEEELDASTLELILQAYPKIKVLDLSEGSVYGSGMSLEVNSLPHLEQLKIDGAFVKNSLIKELLTAAPKLDKEDWANFGEPDSSDSNSNSDSDSNSNSNSNSDSDSDSDSDDIEVTTPMVRNTASEKTLDADTNKKNITYTLEQIFYPDGHTEQPHVSRYRLDVFHEIATNIRPCALSQAFSMKKTGDLGLTAIPNPKNKNTMQEVVPAGHKLYQGRQRLRLTKEWQPLPSLSAKEELVNYTVTPESAVDIQYSTRDNLYYICTTAQSSVDVSFSWTIRVPDEKNVDYPKELEALIKEFRAYKEGALELPRGQQTGTEYLSILLDQRKGACRHRAFAFKHRMQNEFPKIPVRIILNDCHAYVELFFNNEWSRCDLGGYPATINIKNQNKPQPNPAPSPAKEPFKAKTFKPNELPQISDPLQKSLIDKLCLFLNMINRADESALLKHSPTQNHALSYAHRHIQSHLWESTIVQPIVQWDGSKEKLSACMNSFNVLYSHIEQYRYVQGRYFYLGSRLQEFLARLNKPCVLNNPWISVHIQPGLTPGRWFVFGAFGAPKKEVSQEQLYQEVINRLGPVVAIESSTDEGQAINQVPHVTDRNQFIEEGGLLFLPNLVNKDEVLAHLNEQPPFQYSKNALEGLFLKRKEEIPAWVMAVQCPKTRTAATQLLFQWISSTPRTWDSELLACLEPLEQGYKEQFIDYLKHYLTQIQNLSAPHKALYSLLKTKDYDSYFKSSEQVKQQEAQHDWKSYSQNLVNSGGTVKKRLVELSSDNSLKGLRFGIEKVAKSLSRPVFYIHNADDLHCMSPSIVRAANNTGTLKKGPSGPLYDFLQTHHDKAPVLVINYANFSAEEIVRFNELLDTQRKVQGVPLPDKAVIIGLMNKEKEGCYQGSDFYSRFDKISQCPLNEAELHKAIDTPKVVDKTQETPGNTPVINLFHANDWKEKLLGKWILHGHSLVYEEGVLPAILKQSTAVEIQNGLWGDEAFRSFWEDALLRGEILHQGVRYTIPQGLTLIKSEGYNWAALKTKVQIQNTEASKEQVLNPVHLNDYFTHYQFSTTHQSLEPVPGLIEMAKNSGGELFVYLTRPISTNDWARILDECHKQNVTLKVRRAPGVSTPKELGLAEPIVPNMGPAPLWPGVNGLAKTAIIESTDVDATVMQLTQDKNKKIHVIDVSECQPEDLLERIQGALNQETLCFNFNLSKGLLSDPLNSSMNILLKGRFSEELVDKLGPCLLERIKNQGTKSQWILVSDQTASFSAFSPIHKHQVTLEEKKNLLKLSNAEQALLSEPLSRNASLSELYARQSVIKLNTATSSNDAWIGMHTLTPPKKIADSLSKDTALEALEWTKNRLKAIQARLSIYPYVFLTGMSGVGKSTFVLKELSKYCSLFVGENHMKAWAQDKSDKEKILFIDEANLSSRKWSEFEGLFQNPPRIFIDRKLVELTPVHKVVFAGNPVSYGDERRLAPLFQRHGGALLFDPLPAANLYEEVLKPVFNGCKQNDKVLGACAHIISLYSFFVAHSTTDVLISPRELQMMALLTMSFSQNNPNIDLLAITKYYAYEIAKHLIPAPLKDAFAQKFKAPPMTVAMDVTQEKGYLVTESRKEAYQWLSDFLKLSTLRHNTFPLNESVQYGGLGGIILEGEPGMGKSELVIHALRKHGFQEAHLGKPLPTNKPQAAPHFYKMPVSLSNSEKEQLLLQAFDEGAVVLIDEINSAPMMERLLNDLLMGRAPDGRRPQKAGFMVIGTQNPVTMAGRRAPSTALSRRMVTLTLPDYSMSELTEILQSKDVPPLEIDPLITSFRNNRTLAQSQLSPTPPVFRNLLQIAEQVRKAQSHLHNRIPRVNGSGNPTHRVAGPTLPEYAASLGINGNGEKKRGLESPEDTESQAKKPRFADSFAATPPPNIKKDMLLLQWMALQNKPKSTTVNGAVLDECNVLQIPKDGAFITPKQEFSFLPETLSVIPSEPAPLEQTSKKNYAIQNEANDLLNARCGLTTFDMTNLFGSNQASKSLKPILSDPDKEMGIVIAQKKDTAPLRNSSSSHDALSTINGEGVDSVLHPKRKLSEPEETEPKRQRTDRSVSNKPEISMDINAPIIQSNTQSKSVGFFNNNKNPKSAVSFEKITENSWYNADHIKALLKHYLTGCIGVDILDPIDAYQEDGNVLTLNLYYNQLSQTLDQSKDANHFFDTIIVPINLNNQHWSALHIDFKQSSNRLAPTVNYYDPFGREDRLPAPIESALKGVYTEISDKDIHVSTINYQKDNYNCGPWIVSILESLVVRNEILTINFNITQRRLEDIDIIGQMGQEAPNQSINTSMGLL